MTVPFRVITCADADYFHFLPFLEANVERKFGTLPLIYDLGLTPEQKASLRSEILQVPVPAGYKEYGAGHGFILTTHKPACIADALNRSPGGCLYVDADVLFVAPIRVADLGGADVAVTPRHSTERTPKHLENGALNAGVLFFTSRPAARRLIDDWAQACAEGSRTDQMILSDLLADFALLGSLGLETRDGLSVMKLDAHLFNDVRLKTGRVLHFKNAGRNPKIAAKLVRYRRLEERAPYALAALFALRRTVGV